MEPCELCLVKQQLQMYEGVIVDSVTNQNVKIRDNDVERRDVYSWKAPYQEAILKSIHSPNIYIIEYLLYINKFISNVNFFAVMISDFAETWHKLCEQSKTKIPKI